MCRREQCAFVEEADMQITVKTKEAEKF